MFSWHFYTDRMRVFVLLIALSLVLLINVSASPARSMEIAPLAVSLEHDLAALHAQQELLPAEGAKERR